MKLTDTKIIVLFILAMVQLCLVSCEDIFDRSSREDDEIKLEKLRNEINKLSEKVKCEDAGSWKFMPIGSKPCGGPLGYISYSTAIDTNEFIRKVELYTQESEKFNEKWGAISDCSVPRQPTRIVCDKGRPVFIYHQSKKAIGTWLLTETLADPGDGSGRYTPADGPAKYLIFNVDGTVTGQVLPSFDRYEFLDESKIMFSGSASQQMFGYTFIGDELIIRPPCVEACGIKFKRIPTEN